MSGHLAEIAGKRRRVLLRERERREGFLDCMTTVPPETGRRKKRAVIPLGMTVGAWVATVRVAREITASASAFRANGLGRAGRGELESAHIVVALMLQPNAYRRSR